MIAAGPPEAAGAGPAGAVGTDAAGTGTGPVTQKGVLCLVFGLTLLATMGISSLIPALPLLSRAFGLDGAASWPVVAAFALPGLVCIPFVGVMADRHGRKKVLIPSLLLFAGGGLVCALAQSFEQLLVCRFIQGAGSAPLGLLYAAIIADTWRGEERARVMSFNAAVLGFGTALSPALGGALAMLHWRLVFLLPLLALPLVWLASVLPLLRPGGGERLKDYAVRTMALAGSERIRLLLALTLLTFIMLSGPLITCFPLLAEELFQARPLDAGLIIAASSLASGLAAFVLPRLYRRFSVRALLLTATALYVASFCLMPHAPALFWLLGPVSLYGLAQGLNIPLVATLLAGQAPQGQRGAIMALNALLLRLGQNVGPAIFGLLAACFGPGRAIVAGTIPALCIALLVLRKPLPALTDDGEKLAD